MRIGLHDSERSNGYPNIALMKLSAAHKAAGDTVEWYSQFDQYDKVYSSKVFTLTSHDPFLPKGTLKGGTGYGNDAILPEDTEHICPDYSLYNCDRSYGFLTRGCPNKCEWCFVPGKEGDIRPAADIEEFLRHDKCILMTTTSSPTNTALSRSKKLSVSGSRLISTRGLTLG